MPADLPATISATRPPGCVPPAPRAGGGRPRSAFVALVALVVGSAVGCGGDDSTGVTTVPAPGAATAGPGVGPSGVPAEIPPEFPADVALPADLFVEQADVLIGEESRIFEVTGWYDGDPVRAARTYLADLEAQGFEVVSRSEASESLLFVARSADWFVSAGFYPDPIRNVGASVGITVGPAGATPVAG